MPSFAVEPRLPESLRRTPMTHALALALFVSTLVGAPSVSTTDLPRESCEDVRAASIERLERCLARAPRDLELMLDLAAQYEHANRAADAERVYTQALRIDPEDSLLWLRLGELYLANGKADQAREALQHALRFRPGDRRLAALIEQADGRRGR